ncbi:MAG: SbcC/MukB-like Walker B domain-containing protein, partial [Leptonema sp. (in: bacteria)]
NPKRISLHRYVIQVYFETVIKFANERLKKIEPRYILKASEEAKAGKRIAGLNIKVLDKWEGERNIESLSGGESFYVSLALALGLYDIIHTNFSNLHFDFLFIDEGFGSLDEQTLQKVLATINEIFILRDGNSQKQIGLISHVESMRQQIPYQIIINNVNGISSVNYKY